MEIFALSLKKTKLCLVVLAAASTIGGCGLQDEHQEASELNGDTTFVEVFVDTSLVDDADIYTYGAGINAGELEGVAESIFERELRRIGIAHSSGREFFAFKLVLQDLENCRHYQHPNYYNYWSCYNPHSYHWDLSFYGGLQWMGDTFLEIPSREVSLSHIRRLWTQGFRIMLQDLGEQGVLDDIIATPFY